MPRTASAASCRAAAEVCLGRSDLEGLRVAVQGLGNVGMPLCGYLSVAGAALVVSDLDANRCAQAAATYGATVAAPEEIHAQHVDVFAPAALGAVLNDATIPSLRCRVVCGGANNQLAEARHDAALADRVCAGLSGECRRRHRLLSGNHRRPARRGPRFGRAHRRHHSRCVELRRRDRRHPVERRG